MTANEKQVAGTHYKTGIEHWDYVVANDLNYFEGQITKYVTRCRKKNGLQDLEKALHFLEKYVEVYAQVAGGAELPPHATVAPPDIGENVFADTTTYFTVEGYHGSGRNVYSCRTCKTEVHAVDGYNAAAQHSQPCTRPRPVRAG